MLMCFYLAPVGDTDMPWTKEDAKKHNKKAVGRKGVKWAAVANAVLEKTGDDAQAIRAASSAIKKGKKNASHK